MDVEVTEFQDFRAEVVGGLSMVGGTSRTTPKRPPEYHYLGCAVLPPSPPEAPLEKPPVDTLPPPPDEEEEDPPDEEPPSVLAVWPRVLTSASRGRTRV